MSDVAKEDLLTHFDECIRFIVDALVMKNNVLVHWYVSAGHTHTHTHLIIIHNQRNLRVFIPCRRQLFGEQSKRGRRRCVSDALAPDNVYSGAGQVNKYNRHNASMHNRVVFFFCCHTG